MRKFSLRLMLLVMVLAIASGVYAAQDNVGGLWLHARYSVSAQIAGNRAYYGNIRTYTPSLYLVGNYDKYSNTEGTLIVGEGGNYQGIHRYLCPSDVMDFGGSQIIIYSWGDPSLSDLAGQSIFWNLNTTASDGKVTVGAATVPSVSDLTVQDFEGTPLPFVRLTTTSKDVITKINVHFALSGDDSATPVYLGSKLQAVRVTVNAKYTSGSDYGSTYKLTSKNWTDFNNSAIAASGHVITGLSLPYDELVSVVFEYDLGDDTYTWTFTPEARTFGTTQWGNLNSYPIRLSADQTKSFDVTHIPSYYYDVEVSGVNDDVISVDHVFTYSEGGWSGDVYVADSSDLKIYVKGLKYGKTMLKIDMYAQGSGVPTRTSTSTSGYYDDDDNWIVTSRESTDRYLTKSTRYVEVWVENDSKDVNSSLAEPYVSEHTTNARFVEGKPYYPSAAFSYMYAGIKISNPSDLSGHINRYTDSYTGGTYSTGSYTSYPSSEEYTTTEYYGSHKMYTTTISGDTYSYYDYYVSDESEVSSYNFWWEFPDSKDLGGEIHGLSLDAEFRTTAQQLTDFVPYFEAVRSGDILTAINWKFVASSDTSAAVTPSGVSDVDVGIYRRRSNNFRHIGGDYSSSELSGSIDLTSNNAGTTKYNELYWVTISYIYNGVRYHWAFNAMDTASDYVSDWGTLSEDHYISIQAPQSIDLTLSGSYSTDIKIWDTSILSASPASFAQTSAISFDLRGLKEGVTTLSVVVDRGQTYSWITPYTRYYALQRYVHVVSGDIPSADVEVSEDVVFESSDLTLTYSRLFSGYVKLIEGMPVDSIDHSYSFSPLQLTRSKLISADLSFDLYKDKFTGVLYVSTDNTVTSYDLTPTAGASNYISVNGVYGYYRRVYYYLSGSYIPEGGATLRWVFSDDVNNDGEATVSYIQPPMSDDVQWNTRRPFVNFALDGLNVAGLTWGFKDSADNVLTSGMPTANLYVYCKYVNSLGNAYIQDIASASGTGGTISISHPEAYIYYAIVSFTVDSVNYNWYFSSPTSTWDGNDYSSTDSTYISDWDGMVSADYIPLIMKQGESKDITISLSTSYTPVPYVGDSSIINMDVISADTSKVQMTLTALKPGMTTLTIGFNNGRRSTWAREIWVADEDGAVPHLTDDVNELVTDLRGMLALNKVSGDSSGVSSGAGTGSVGSTASDDVSGTAAYDEGTYEALSGLSVNPRFSMPRDPAENAVASMWDAMDAAGLEHDVTVLDERYVVESRDALTVFDELKEELIDLSTPQLAAVILPVIEVEEDGFYTFSISVDNIPADRAIFWHAYKHTSTNSALPAMVGASISDAQTASLKSNMWVFMNDSGDITSVTISGDDTVNVSAYLRAGKYAPVITAEATLNDENIVRATLPRPADPTPATSPDIRPTSPDRPASPDIRPISPDRPASPDIRPTSPDQPGPVSPDIRPTSPDRPAPASPDIRPISPDQPAPVSPDVIPISPDQPAPISPDQPAPVSPDRPAPTPGGDTPGGDTPSGEVVPVSTTPESPAVDITSDSVVQTILNALRTIVSFITGSTEVAELPEEAVGTERSIDDVSEEELAQIPEDEEPAAVLPIMRVQKPAVYVFRVTLSNLRAGVPIRMHMMAQADIATASEFTAAESEQDAYTFMNDDGEEITTVPANKGVNVAAYMEPGYTYAPIITTASTSSEGGDTPGTDTPGTDTPGTDTPTTRSVGSSGGGCDSGFSFMAVAVLGLLAKLTKKRFVK